MTLRPRYLAGVLALGLALTACSSSGNNTPAAPPTTPVIAPPSTTSSSSTPAPAPTTSPVTSSAATGTAPSHDALTSIVVQQGDVPSGYTSKASDTSDADDQSSQAEIIQCVGSTSVNPSDRIEEVHGDDFVKDPLTISSDATSYTSQAAVSALVSVITNSKAQGCFNQLLKQQVEANGATVSSSNITVTPGTNGGPSNVVAVLTGSITVQAQGQQATLNVWEAFITGRQLLATVSGQAIGGAVDTNVVQQAAAAVASRAAAA